jgi:hypothetical protein
MVSTTMDNDGNSTFIKVTNKDIYEKLGAIEKKLGAIESHVKETNGKVKLNRWIATTALTMVTAIIFFLLK